MVNNIKEKIKTVSDFSKKLSKFKKEPQFFLKEIKNMTEQYLEDRKRYYKKHSLNKDESLRPVNFLRYILLDKITSNEKVNISIIKEIKKNILKKNQKFFREYSEYQKPIKELNSNNPYLNWSNFKILFYIYYHKFQNEIEDNLESISEYIINQLDIKNYKTKIAGFNWNNQFGSDFSWIAIYPENFNNYSNCFQLSVIFQKEIIEYGILPGFNLKKNHNINFKKTKKSKIDNLDCDKIISFLKKEIKPIYYKKNEEIKLKEPFNQIFENKKETIWFFNILSKILKEIGIENNKNRDFKISLRKKKKTIRLILRRRTIFEIIMNKKRKIGLFLLSQPEKGEKDYNFSHKGSLYKISLQDFKKNEKEWLNKIIEGAKYIKKEINVSTTNQNRCKRLEDVIFNNKELEKVLDEGIIEKTEKYNYFILRTGSEEYTDTKKEYHFKEGIPGSNQIRKTNKVKFVYLKNNKFYATGEIKKFKKKEIGGKNHLFAQITNYHELENKISLKEIKKDLNYSLKQYGIMKISKNQYNIILKDRVKEKRVEYNTKIEVNFSKKLKINKELYFPENQKEKLESRITTALRSGKHIILIGPPGTGKSKLAKIICKNYNNNYEMTTATSDWSTFDTIGGYRPKENQKLEFHPGIFLKCFQKENEKTNKWLIIDEINRADIDKAFGSLFSALTGDNITLSFERNKKPINLIGKPKKDEEYESNNFLIDEDWRLIATMNSLDKTSLYEMSYAFMRRFAFIPVDIPERIDKKEIKNYKERWGLNSKNNQKITELWNKINEFRKIGPALIKDICEYVEINEDYSSAIALYVLPQLEGLTDTKIKGFVKKVGEVIDNKNELKKATYNFFDLKDES